MTYPYFQPAQTNSLRILNKRHADMGHFKGANSKAHKTWWASVFELVHRFAKGSTIHGISRLLGDSSGRIERIVWLLALMIALMGATYVCLILSARFNAGKLETVIDSTRMPVYRIAFPVITICNKNHLNWLRLEEAKQIFLPGEKSEFKLQLFERVIGTYDDLRFGNFYNFGVLQDEPLEMLNNVNFSNVFEFMTWRCEEFLTECVWRHLPIDCCEIFSKRRSKNGLCWSFNTLETVEGKRMQRLDPKWPWRSGSSGPTSGLTVRVLINPEKHFPNRTNEKGLTVMVTEPLVWHVDPSEVPDNTHTVVQFEPIIYFYDNETRVISSEQRQCVFQDEHTSQNYKSLQGYIYMNENCESQCHQEYLVHYCNCTMDLLFPPGPYQSCKVKDLPCLSKYNDFFVYMHQPGEEEYVSNHYTGMVCKCFRNCYSLNFYTDVRPTFLPPAVRGNLSYVDLDAHFRYDVLMVYRTSLVFDWLDLMVAFGGIAGLFLGCSLISGAELAYFVVIDIPTFIVRKLKKHWQRRSKNPTHPKHRVSNRMLAVDRQKQGHYIIKGNQNGPIIRVEPNRYMRWMPQKINRQNRRVNE